MINIEIMNTLIGAQISMGQMIEVKEITFPLLQSLGIKSNKVTYELLIDYYFKKNEFDKIFELEI